MKPQLGGGDRGQALASYSYLRRFFYLLRDGEGLEGGVAPLDLKTPLLGSLSTAGFLSRNGFLSTNGLLSRNEFLSRNGFLSRNVFLSRHGWKELRPLDLITPLLGSLSTGGFWSRNGLFSRNNLKGASPP